MALLADWCLPRRGGIETHILSLARHLRARGADVRIVTSFPGPSEIEGVPVDRLDCTLFPGASIAVSPSLIRIVRAALERQSFDVVHIHASIVAPLCLAAIPAARSLGLPAVLTFHSVMRTLPALLAGLNRLIHWSRSCTAITAVSGLVAGQINRAMGEGRASVLPNGFDHGFWTTQISERRGDPFHIVSALRLERKKRPLALIDIFGQALRDSAKAGGPEIILTIAGDGKLRQKLERRVREAGLSGHIFFVGWQSPAELRSLYAKASAFVMPSVREAFCIAAIEARAAGLPVLARAGTGIAEFIRHEENGLLAGSDAEMARLLAGLANDPAELERLRTSNVPLLRYDWSALAAEHMEIYQAALARGASVPAA